MAATQFMGLPQLMGTNYKKMDTIKSTSSGSTSGSTSELQKIVELLNVIQKQIETNRTKGGDMDSIKQLLQSPNLAKTVNEIKGTIKISQANEVLSESDELQKIVTLTRSFIFDEIREFVNIVFFIIDSIHDNFSSRVSGLSKIIHSIVKEIHAYDKGQSLAKFDWAGLYGDGEAASDSTTQFYHYLMGNSKIIHGFLESLFNRLRHEDLSINEINKKLKEIFNVSFDLQQEHISSNEECIKHFLRIFTGDFKNKLSDASAKKALKALMSFDKCGIDITDDEIKDLPLYKFLETYSVYDMTLTTLTYYVYNKDYTTPTEPDDEYLKYLTTQNAKTVQDIIEQQRINIVRDVVASCNTDITTDVRLLSIQVRELLHEQLTLHGDTTDIDDDLLIDKAFLSLIATDTEKYIALLHKSADEDPTLGTTSFQSDVQLCTDLQKRLFTLGAEHFSKKKCVCKKCGKTDFYSKYPIKTINYEELWMSKYEVDVTETTGGWSVKKNDDGKKRWRLETYMALLLTSRVLMSGSNVIDMKTSGYAKCVKANNIGFISNADFVSDDTVLHFTQPNDPKKIDGRDLWLKCGNDIEALANARFTIKTWQQDSGYIFPMDCISSPTDPKKSLTLTNQNIILSNENVIKSTNVDPAVLINFYLKIIETVSSAVQLDQAGSSTNKAKQKFMVLLYFFNGYKTAGDNYMLNNALDGVLSGIDGFGQNSYSDEVAGVKLGFMEWWKISLHTKEGTDLSTQAIQAIPTGPALNTGTMELGGWKTRMKPPYHIMNWYESLPNITPPYGVAVLVKNAAKLIKKLLNDYKSSSQQKYEQLRKLINVMAITINTKLMGDWSQQEINKYITRGIRDKHSYYTFAGALWSYIISVDGLLSTSSFLCGVRSQLDRNSGRIHEYRIGDVYSGHTIDKPIVFLLDTLGDLHDIAKYKFEITAENAVLLDLRDYNEDGGAIKAYIDELQEIYVNKLNELLNPPTIEKDHDISVEDLLRTHTWKIEPDDLNDDNLTFGKICKSMKILYERESVEFYHSTDRAKLVADDTSFDSEYFDEVITDDDFAKIFVPDSDVKTFFNRGGGRDDDIYEKVFPTGSTDQVDALKLLKKYIREQKLLQYKKNKTEFTRENGLIASTITKLYQEAQGLVMVTAEDIEPHKFYIHIYDGAYVKMSDISIESINKLLSGIQNFKTSIDGSSIDALVTKMLELIGKAIFNYVNVHYITGTGMYNATMDIDSKSGNGWFSKESTSKPVQGWGVYATNNIYRHGKTTVLCDDLSPKEPVIVHPNYYPSFIKYDHLTERQIKQLQNWSRVNIFKKIKSNTYSRAEKQLTFWHLLVSDIKNYHGKHSIYFRSKENTTIFYNLLFGEKMIESYYPGGVGPQSDIHEDGGYIKVVINSFKYALNYRNFYDDDDELDNEKIFKQIKINWALMFSMETLLDRYIENVNEVVSLVLNEPTSECTLRTNCPDLFGLSPISEDDDASKEAAANEMTKIHAKELCSCWKSDKGGGIVPKTPMSGKQVISHPAHTEMLNWKQMYHPSIFGNPLGQMDQPSQMETISNAVLGIMGPFIKNNDVPDGIKSILELCGIFKEPIDGGDYSVDLDRYKQQFEFYEKVEQDKYNRSAEYRRLQLKIIRRFVYYRNFCTTTSVWGGMEYDFEGRGDLNLDRFREKMFTLYCSYKDGDDVWSKPENQDIFMFCRKQFARLIKLWSDYSFNDEGIFDKYKELSPEQLESYIQLHFRLYEVFGTVVYAELNEIVTKLNQYYPRPSEPPAITSIATIEKELIIKFLLI